MQRRSARCARLQQGEAEAAAAALNAAGLADAVLSFDSDALLFGATVLFKVSARGGGQVTRTRAHTFSA